MIRQTILVVSAALGISLIGFGISHAAMPLAEFDLKAPGTYSKSELIDSLSLTAQQRSEYDKLAKWMKTECDRLKEYSSKAMARGMELNAQWKDGLQRIFTREQYRTFTRNSGWVIISDGTYLATPSGRAREDKILESLNLSGSQRNALNSLCADIEVERRKLDQLWKGRDMAAIEDLGYKINDMQSSGMVRILSREQYSNYSRYWSLPAPKPTGTAYSPAKKIG